MDQIEPKRTSVSDPHSTGSDGANEPRIPSNHNRKYNIWGEVLQNCNFIQFVAQTSCVEEEEKEVCVYVRTLSCSNLVVTDVPQPVSMMIVPPPLGVCSLITREMRLPRASVCACVCGGEPRALSASEANV